jgi:uncharacterized membrane protein YtjA (UPF0391 family)
VPTVATIDSATGPPLQSSSGALLEHVVVFLMLALVAAFAGARGVAGIDMEIARVLVSRFLVLATVSTVL